MISEHFRNIFNIPDLRRKLLFTFGLLIVYRVGFHIPIPSLNLDQLNDFKSGHGAAQGILVFLSTISGGGLDSLSVFSLGIMPYISASIIFSMLVKVFPTLEEIQKEGASGQQKINQWTRMATVPLCLVQSAFIINLLSDPISIGQGRTIHLIPADSGFGFWVTSCVAFTAGALFLMWIGEMITEHGVSNGISLLIMAGIVARLPQVGWELINPTDPTQSPLIGQVVVFFVLFVLIVLGVTLVQEGQRRIPIQQAKNVKGQKVYGGQRSHFPIRVNQAGVMPVIFASSLMIFPSVIISKLGFTQGTLADMMDPSGWFYIVIYVGMIYFFSYFWNSLMFQPEELVRNLKEHGSFVPGIRPGRWTAEFLERVMNRMTYVGAGFLAFIALLPNVIVSLMGLNTAAQMQVAYFLGGTGILIVVSVVLEFVQKVESHLMMRSYRGFIKDRSGRGRSRR